MADDELIVEIEKAFWPKGVMRGLPPVLRALGDKHGNIVLAAQPTKGSILVKGAADKIKEVKPGLRAVIEEHFPDAPVPQVLLADGELGAAGDDAMEDDDSAPHFFVDAKSKVTYRLWGADLYLDEKWIASVNATADPNQIEVIKGENGFKDDKLWRLDGPVDSAPNAADWFSISRLHGEEISVADFRKRYPGSGVVHIKGFGDGMASVYDKEITAQLRKFKVLVWDGDDYKDEGFTKWVPKFLDSNSSGVAVCFKKRFEIPKFNSRWAEWMAKYPQKIKVVAIDYPEDAEANGVVAEQEKYVSALPGWAQEYFALGRVANKSSGSKQVVALGGGGIAGNEADAAFADGVHWTVYALSRGKKEAYPALCDFAHKNKSNKNMTFVTGKDPNEKDAFQTAPGEAPPPAQVPEPTVKKALPAQVAKPESPPRPAAGVAVPASYDPPAVGRKRPCPPSAASSDLIWECTRNTSSFIRRPTTGDRRKGFSSDPTNLTGLHRPKYCGLSAIEPLNVRSVKQRDKESIEMVQSHSNAVKASYPTSALVTTGLSKCPKRGLLQLDRELDGKFYRRGLHSVAREKYVKVQKSFKKKKRTVKSRRVKK